MGIIVKLKLIFSSYRPALVDFANEITKKVSLLICGHSMVDAANKNLSTLKTNVETWLKDHQVKGFYLVSQSSNHQEGVRNLIHMAGLGKLSPNVLMMGFRGDWKRDLSMTADYMQALYCAFEQRLSVTILRVRDGFDYSSQIGHEKTVTQVVKVVDDNSDDEGQAPAELKPKVAKTRKVSTAVYRGIDGLPLQSKTMANIELFKDKKKSGFIDVWWLYDDGGLTLLLPYIMTTRKQFKVSKNTETKSDSVLVYHFRKSHF